jgi:hypothetical protein
VTAVAGNRRLLARDDGAQFRYGAVFLVVITLAVFEILAPATSLARAFDVALAAGALTVAVATSRERGQVRRARASIVGGVAVVVVIGIATGGLHTGVTFAVVTVLVALIPVALAGGLLRLIRDRGVTIQVVAGALAIYVTVGLLFASFIAFVSHVQSGYFAQRGIVSVGDDVYYSFTVLTTTGFGDFTAATPVGHALAVLEMLLGQLYLVTVIGLVVGNFAGQRIKRD